MFPKHGDIDGKGAGCRRVVLKEGTRSAGRFGRLWDPIDGGPGMVMRLIEKVRVRRLPDKLERDSGHGKQESANAPGKLATGGLAVQGTSGFISQVWLDFMPYLRAILVSLLKTSALLMSFMVLRRLTKTIDGPGWLGSLVETIHSLEISAGLILFAIFFILDLFKISK